MQYVQQIVQQGILEIAYHEKQALKLTSLAKQILFEKKPVKLIAAKDKKTIEKAPVKKVVNLNVDEALFQLLRSTRKEIASKKGFAPYMVFSDKALQEMAADKPTTGLQFAQVSGVGNAKLKAYGNTFVKMICDYEKKPFSAFSLGDVSPQTSKPTKTRKKASKSKKKSTYQITFELLKEGKDLGVISTQRGLSSTTVMSHIVKLFEEKQVLDLTPWINTAHFEQVKNAYEKLGKQDTLTSYYAHLNEEVPYSQIRLALAVIKREEG